MYVSSTPYFSASAEWLHFVPVVADSSKPDWPKFFSYAPDIWSYLDRVCNCFDLRKYMSFNTEVIGCFWNANDGKWTVKLRQTTPGQKPREFEDTCDLLLHGTGALNNFKWPDVEGLGTFKGKVIRTYSDEFHLEMVLIC